LDPNNTQFTPSAKKMRLSDGAHKGEVELPGSVVDNWKSVYDYLSRTSDNSQILRAEQCEKHT